MNELQKCEYALEEITKNIKESLDNQRIYVKQISEEFVKTGYFLKRVRDTSILYESGYSSLTEYAKKELDLGSDAVSRYIAINDRFSEGGYGQQLREEMQGYGVAKLQEMLTLSDEVIEALPKDISKREVQEIKKEIKEEQKITDIEVALEQVHEGPVPLETNLEKFIWFYFEQNKEQFVKMHENLTIEGLLDAIVPSGIGVLRTRIPGAGTVMLSIKGRDNDLDLVNVRTNESEKIQWESVLDTIKYLYYVLPEPKKDWEKAYEWPFDTPDNNTGVISPVRQQEKADAEEEKEEIPGNEPEDTKNEPEEIKNEPENVNKETVNVEKSSVEQESSEIESDEKEPEKAENEEENKPLAIEIIPNSQVEIVENVENTKSPSNLAGCIDSIYNSSIRLNIAINKREWSEALTEVKELEKYLEKAVLGLEE